MANKKLKQNQVEQLLSLFDEGVAPSDLATKFGVHHSTIIRYLSMNGRTAGRQSHRVLLDSKTKVLIRRVLAKYNVNNMDILISELDSNFIIRPREQEDSDFTVIQV